MDIKKLQQTGMDFLKKYRYVILILLLGIAFMLLPGNEKPESNIQTSTRQINNIPLPEERLEDVLAQIQGAGRVKVMLTQASGEEHIYQVDEESSHSDKDSKLERKTVILSDAARNQTALIKQVNPPEYLGAIVICQGADSAKVRLAMVDAVMKVTGLGADCISVLKMK